jgi:hypothetical protein
MSEEETGTKKAVKTPAVKKAASEKKAPVKKAAVKKTSVKKTNVEKTSAGDKKTAAETVALSPQIDPNIVPTIQSMVQEMSQDRESRDKQISSLIQEVRDGFTILSEKTSKQGADHEKEMTSLYQSLQNAFGMIKTSSNENEDRNLSIFKSLSDSIMMDHEQTLKEVHEQERLQDKKISYFDKIQEQRSGRNRLIAIPAVILAIIGIVYMFKVVNIMESAMTSMSQDMHEIQLSVGGMTDKIGTISQDTTSMNANMQQLNGNTHQMSKDLNVMTNNVAPAMKGMRDVMPWSP